MRVVSASGRSPFYALLPLINFWEAEKLCEREEAARRVYIWKSMAHANMNYRPPSEKNCMHVRCEWTRGWLCCCFCGGGGGLLLPPPSAHWWWLSYSWHFALRARRVRKLFKSSRVTKDVHFTSRQHKLFSELLSDFWSESSGADKDNSVTFWREKVYSLVNKIVMWIIIKKQSHFAQWNL